MATAHVDLDDGRDCFEWSISQKLSPSQMSTSFKGVTLLTSFRAVMDPMQACVCAPIEQNSASSGSPHNTLQSLFWITHHAWHTSLEQFSCQFHASWVRATGPNIWPLIVCKLHCFITHFFHQVTLCTVGCMYLLSDFWLWSVKEVGRWDRVLHDLRREGASEVDSTWGVCTVAVCSNCMCKFCLFVCT